MSYRGIPFLALTIGLLAGACSVDVDQYEFVPDDQIGDGDSGDGDSGDGDSGDGDVGDGDSGDGDSGDGDSGDGDSGDGDGAVLSDARDRVSAQWATDCIEGDPALMGADPGIMYVYTFDDGEMRLDMWAFFSDCSDPLWVQSIMADYEIIKFDRTAGTFTMQLTITAFDIMLLDEDVAAEANAAGPNGEGLYGRTDWVASEWIDLLGYPTDNGTLNEGDMGYLAFVFLGADEAIGASLITLGAIPTRVLKVEFNRTDGDLGADNL